MKAFITAQISEEAREKMKSLINDEIIYENWRETKNLYFSAPDLVSKIKETGAEIFICEGDNVKEDVLNNVDLKIIASTRDDPNNIHLETATKKGIPVIYTPKRNTISVAELTVTLILALAKKFHKVDRTVQGKNYNVEEFSDWITYINEFMGINLAGKTVGIIGLGSIGYEVAKRLLPFKVKFLVFDPYVTPRRLGSINASAVSLETLMTQSDFVTIHCPPTDETDDIVSEEHISMMKPSAYFINLGRASVTDEDALLEALKEKRIAGAALDVFSVEPVDQDNEFRCLENVIVTPHLGGNTVDTINTHSIMVVDAIEKILKGEIPRNVLNPEVLGGAPEARTDPEQSNTFIMRREIVDVCMKMIEKEYIVGTAGNVSMRVQREDGEDLFLITPSNVNYNEMSPEDIVLVDGDGNVVEGNRNPSSEKMMHIAIYKARNDVNAVLHSHAPFSTALSIAKIPIGPIVDEFIPFVGGCEVAEFGMAGSTDLAGNAVEALGENYAVLIANHGNVCCGKHMEHAWTILKMVEQTAKIQHFAMMHGTIYALPEDAEEEEKEIFDIMKDMG